MIDLWVLCRLFIKYKEMWITIKTTHSTITEQNETFTYTPDLLKKGEIKLFMHIYSMYNRYSHPVVVKVAQVWTIDIFSPCLNILIKMHLKLSFVAYACCIG